MVELVKTKSVFAVRVTQENIVKSQCAKRNVKMGEDALGLIGVHASTVTPEDTVKLTTELVLAIEELKMTNVLDNCKGLSAPNSFAVPPLEKLGVILVKDVRLSLIAILAF